MSTAPLRPDPALYPFAAHWHATPEGQMHYVDEGSGAPVLLVHGTPTWSFLYRELIRRLARTHRVVAADHLGFGLSDKPEEAAYRPQDHARRLAGLIEALGLREITLVVHDFGGPIGLAYAIEHPDRVARLVLFNSWMWSLAGDRTAERASRLLGGPLGCFLYRQLNFSPKVLLKAAFADKAKLSPAVHRHYTDVFPAARKRTAPWVLARELTGSSAWYDALWVRRDRFAGKPALLLWGMQDPTFGPAALERWRSVLADARVVEFPEAGHFVMEEAPEAAASEVEAFLASGGGVQVAAPPR